MIQVIHALLTHFIPWVFVPALLITIGFCAILIINLNKYPNPSLPRSLLFFVLISLTTISLMVVMAQFYPLIAEYKEISDSVFDSLAMRIEMLAQDNMGFALWLLIWGGPMVYGGLLCVVLLCACLLFFATRLYLKRKPKELGFAAHKDLALGKVLWLNMLFIVVFVLFFMLCFCVFELIFWLAMPAIFDEPDSFSFLTDNIRKQMGWFIYSLGLSAGILLVIFGSFVVKSLLLSRHSIDRLAKTLKAIEITPKKYKNHRKYARLLNVVEEIAIASAMPMPRVFVMREEQGINAMCSGERFGKSDERFALFFTQGALDTLSREELSGVVGHEFSHAFHQDVALNLRIFSLIFGFMSISFIGEILMRSIARRTGAAGKRDSKGEAVIALFAFSFYALGLLGTLCASLIQAAISRQKEFLADATSVQYTRNPNAILCALQTIAQEQSPKESQERKLAKDTQGFLDNKLAKPCAHMFFLQGFKGAFATHPPIHKRIETLQAMARI
ncbi:M48 family metalloprotease [Helicobacter zhangjianzhongii]|uniref:M48 family metalloprotease n=1 Tax=Helicobacter zhangjianzhongii TaxID=2974574 RepID=UPI0025579ACE|nr:M48 family metalloprotease [Helicobacter sp. CPD2-1]MDL0079781.1 M48 family metalloprotease [Helicobacter sp. CPD2-1]